MGIKQAYRTVVESLPPPVGLRLAGAVGYMRKKRVREEWYRRKSLWVRAGRPTKVVAGPFAGMPWLTGWTYGNILPTLFGAYELELHPSVERIVQSGPDRIIDVGSADGYYVVGLARRLPSCRVIGFDMLASQRWLLGRHAAMSRVADRVEQRKRCEPDFLADALRGAANPVVICDCEGYEDVLLDPERIPALRSATVLVEVHDGNIPVAPHLAHFNWDFPKGVTERLRERFSPTHDIQTIVERPRTASDRPAGLPLTDEEYIEATLERRGVPGFWYFMVPRA